MAEFGTLTIASMKVALVWDYLLNFLGMLLLLFLPSVLWYRLFTGKGLHFSPISLSLFFASVVAFILMPAFKLKMVDSDQLVGVDIVTQGVLGSANPVHHVFLLSVVIGIITLVLSSPSCTGSTTTSPTRATPRWRT